MSSTRCTLTAALTAVMLGGAVLATEPPRPESGDRCAVCGMFVAKYPNWVAAVEYGDGARVFFDGPKDMFRYLHDPAKYAPARKGEAVTAVWVTDYYTTRMMDGREALFVAGSNVTGPMGPELVPLAGPEEAESFRSDHGGDPPLRFEEVTREKIRR